MFDDIFLVFNEYAYQFERDLRITREKQGYYCAEWFIYSCIGLKIYHNFCVMLWASVQVISSLDLSRVAHINKQRVIRLRFS